MATSSTRRPVPPDASRPSPTHLDRIPAPGSATLPVVLLLGLAALGCATSGSPPAPSGEPSPAAASPVSAPGDQAGPAAVDLADADRRWTLVTQGRKSGEVACRVEADGLRRCRLAFNDRGRGPRLETLYRLDGDHLPVTVETTGHDYLGSPVDERFARRDGEATWSSGREAGEAPVDGPAFYVGVQGAHPEIAHLAAALEASEGGVLDLLPAGRARLGNRLEREVDTGEGGEPLALTLVSVEGLGFAPVTAWLDADGALFAQISSWGGVVHEGHEDLLPMLLEVQQQAAAEREARLAAELLERPKEGLAITGVAVFDPVSGTRRSDRTVLVEGERITAEGPAEEIAVPAGFRVLDGAGATLLPGLWDLHVHATGGDGLLHLVAGVTSVRDLANDTDAVLDLARRWGAGEAPGPRMVLAGFMDGPGPYAGPTRVLVDTREEALEWVERYADLGFEQIKVYSSLDPALVPAIAERAHARGLRLSGHVPQGLDAEQAVHLGFDELQHVNFLFLNFLADESVDTRTPARFLLPAIEGAGLDLDSNEVGSFVRLLAERGTVVDPTLAIFETMLLGRPGEVAPTYRPVIERFPPQVQRQLAGGGLGVPEDLAAERGEDGARALYAESFEAFQAMVRTLHQAGVPLVAGTDALAGFTLHRELELYADAGIPPAEVLRIATLGAAEVTGRAEELGTIEPGKLADLVLVAGDPLEDISAVRDVEAVVLGGAVLDLAEAERVLGPAPGGAGAGQPPM